MIPTKETNFWTGVVEDRQDPLFLGRCRVRIHGIHSKFKSPSSTSPTDDPNSDYVPIDQLPWAYPVQGITSAAMTGIGHAPVGPVEGTWIVGFFLDGPDQQLPIMLGTIGGIELKKDQQDQSSNSSPGSSVVSPDGSPVTSSDGQPVQSPTPPPTTPAGSSGGIGLGAMTQADLDNYKAAIGKRESSGNYGATNQFGYLGKYQFGGDALKGQGFTYAGGNTKLSSSADWTGKDGCSSTQDFLNSPQAQESAMDDFTKANYQTLLNNGTLNANSTQEEIAGSLAVAHLLGPNAARQLAQSGTDGADGNGTKGSSYYKIGSQAVGGGGVSPIPSPTVGLAKPIANFPTTPSSNPTSPASFGSGDNVGFKDPNKVYPKFPDGLDKVPDTNLLAYNDHIDKTSVKKKKDGQVTGVKTANEGDDWDQPTPPYNATYPYNHIFESESGHSLEFDDTAQNERISLFHTKGTFTEIDCNGTLVNRIIGDSYQIMDRNGFISIDGKCNITIGGDARIYVKNNAEVQVDGKSHLVCYNDVRGEFSGDLDFSVRETFNVRAKEIHLETNDDGGEEAFTIRNNNEDASIKIYSKGKIETYSEKNMDFYTDNQKMSFRATNPIYAGTIAIDACFLIMQRDVSEMATRVDEVLADDKQMYVPKEKKNPQEPDMPTLSTPSQQDKVAFFYDDGFYPPDEVESHIQNQTNNGNYAPADLAKGPDFVNNTTTDNTPTPEGPAVPVNSNPPPAGFNSAATYSPALVLSPNISLGQLTTGTIFNPTALVDQRGLSVGDIAQNLHVLSNVGLEPILAQFPNMNIAGAFRLALSSNIVSQHEIGQAADLVFQGFSMAQYYDAAAWIRDNLPTFDQLVLNYKTTGTGQPWIHLSVSPVANAKQVLTMVNHQIIGATLATTNAVAASKGAVATVTRIIA